jgi:hypothetical protein
LADERPNRVELEYGATVDRPSMDAAKAEAVRNAEETQRDVSRVAAKPASVANAEAASQAAAAREAQAAAAGRAAEAEARLRTEQDRLYSSVSRTNDRALELAASFGRLTNTRFGETVNRQANIAEGQLVRLRAQAQTFRRILEDPASQQPDIIARVAPLAARAEQRIEQLTRRLRELEAEGKRATRGRDPFDLGDAAGRAGGGGGGGLNPFMARRIAQVGAQSLGLPGIAGSIGGLEAMGGGLAAVGVVLGAVAGIRELIKLSNEAEKSQFNLAAAAQNAGEGFQQARDDAEVFRASLGVTREDANLLAASLAQLRLRTGQALNNEDTKKLATLVRAQGLEGQEGADALSGLAKGSAEAFERLTGSRADVTLDRYARSLGTTVARLTDMQKAQALTNAALEDSAKLQALAEQRTGSLAAKTDSFFNSLKDLGAEYGRAFYEGVILNQSAAESAAQRQRELGTGEGSGVAYLAQLNAQKARREEERIANEQQAARIAQERQIEEEARRARALPEDYGAGLSPVGRERAELERLRARRETVRSAAEDLNARRDEFSTDDFEKFSNQFKDQLQSLTDEIRNRVEAAASEARGHVQALAKDIQGATEEFTNLRLPGEQNPYVKLFSDGERALESLRQRFALLSSEQRQAFAEQIEGAQQARLYDLRVKDAMSAVALEFQAAELSKPFEELTGEMKRTLSVFEAGLKAATANPGLQANANLVEARQRYRFGFNGNDRLLRGEGLQLDASGALGLNPDAIARQEFDNLLRLRSRFGNAPGLAGEQIRNQLNQQIGQIYGRLSPQALAGVARDPSLSATFAGSFREQAAFNESQLRRASRIAELGAPSLRLANEQLRALSETAGANDPANRNRTRAEFLAVTGAIPREELTPELIAGRVTALREEASFRAESEQRAQTAFTETRAFQRALIGEGGEGGKLNDILGAIRDRNERVIVEVNNRSERATVATLGSAF